MTSAEIRALGDLTVLALTIDGELLPAVWALGP
jgi:hypothetical protein